MARKVPRGEAYTHDEGTRKNNPEAGMVDYAPVTKETKTAYCWDPRESPQLVWAGKAGLKKVEVDEQTSLEVPHTRITLRGVDLYEPLTGEVSSDSGHNVHAVFIDHGYDGKSFCSCQALFPSKKVSSDKIARNLRGAVNEEAFEAFRTTVSLPFRPGADGKVQVKVIDARGNAIVKTVRVWAPCLNAFSSNSRRFDQPAVTRSMRSRWW